MSERKLTVARLTEILRRQRPQVFGTGYEPSIKATREEAPIGSRPATVYSTLIGRDIHTLSGPERAALVIVPLPARPFRAAGTAHVAVPTRPTSS